MLKGIHAKYLLIAGKQKLHASDVCYLNATSNSVLVRNEATSF